MPQLFGWQDQGIAFDLAVHMGTLFAVLTYFWRDTFTLCRASVDICTLTFDTPDARLALKLICSTIPVVFLGLMVADFIATDARNLMLLGITSILFGLLLGYFDWKPQNRLTDISQITFKEAWVFGLFQAIALIPGTSRSGITITAGLMLGANRATATRYGSLMAIPVTFLAAIYGIAHNFDGALNWQNDWRLFVEAMMLTAITAFICLHFMMRYLTRTGYWPFVIYRLIMGTVLIYLAL
jgi:undecaprenyl-diphosphatase